MIEKTALAASETLRRSAERSEGERSGRAMAGALVLRALALRCSGAVGATFVLARAGQEVGALPAGPERRALRRLLQLSESGVSPQRRPGAGVSGAVLSAPATMASALLAYAAELERTDRLRAASVVLALAREARPEDPVLALHAGRIARKLGETDRARAYYGEVRGLDAPCGRFARLAGIGEALVSEHPASELGCAIRDAVQAGDAEAVAIGLEERARVLAKSGEYRAAQRDLVAAALRCTDPDDRARVLHRLADIATDLEDARLAREVLLLALGVGSALQRTRARGRLYDLSVELGDELGQRRWRPAEQGARASHANDRPDHATSPAGQAPTPSAEVHRLEHLERALSAPDE